MIIGKRASTPNRPFVSAQMRGGTLQRFLQKPIHQLRTGPPPPNAKKDQNNGKFCLKTDPGNFCYSMNERVDHTVLKGNPVNENVHRKRAEHCN